MLLWNVFLEILLPILMMFGCGWILDRRFDLDLATLVKLNIYLVVPAFIFYEVVSSSLSAPLALRVILFTLTIIAGMFFLSLLAAWLLRFSPQERRSLQLATMFYNSGNYGIPLMTLAFPGVGPLLQVFVVLTQNIATFTVGLLLASPERIGLRALLPMLRQVALWAVTAALLIRWLEIPVMEWKWIWAPLGYFHRALVAVALITLGAQLSKTTTRQSFSRISCALVLRLLVAPLLACVLVAPFGFRGETAAIMIVSTGVPTAVNTALLAHEFNADSQFAAATVFYSTLLSMLSVTLLIALFRFRSIASLP